MSALPERLTTPEVLQLARYGRVTLWRRQKSGAMPARIDRGTDGDIFDRDAVLKALGMAQDEKAEQRDPWDFDLDAVKAAFARPVRRPQTAR